MPDENKSLREIVANMTAAEPPAVCPDCELQCAIPAATHFDERLQSDNPLELVCTGCGAMWEERNPVIVSLAWYAAGMGEADDRAIAAATRRQN